jgi:predicted RNA-binding Zn-ribbon protein involved in translation (DUF1610 family)
MFNVRVEYDRTPIRHISVQCPKCNKWFYGWDILKGEKTFDVLKYAHDINFAEFECPVCGAEFGGLQHADKPNVKEVVYPEVYEGCVQKKEVWE